jgi:hypothetical protein
MLERGTRLAESVSAEATEKLTSGGRQAGHRYGAVFLVTLIAVVFAIAAPAGAVSRAVFLALEFGALAIVVATSRDRPEVRRARTLGVTLVAGVAVILVAVGAMPGIVTFGISLIIGVSIPLGIIGGLVRLLRTRGVTVQAVAGALAIFLFVGLIFASVISITAKASPKPYFTNGTDGTQSERVYYSFTVLTTTGFGDFTAQISAGRAIAVIEMLTGQLYLVTVIGILVGDIAGRQRGPLPPKD